MLKINLLPPTRKQRAAKWCKEMAEMLCCLLVVLVCLPVVAVVYVVVYVSVMLYKGAHTGGRAVMRIVMGIRRGISVQQAIEIAEREVGAQGRYCFTDLKERLATYEIRVEAPPVAIKLQEGKAMHLTVDIRDGQIITSTTVPCLHTYEDELLCNS